MSRSYAIMACGLLLLSGGAMATEIIGNWLQCGGQGANCAAHVCSDAVYPDTACEEGWSCQRQNAWYWQCLEGSVTPPVVTDIPLYGQCGGKGGVCGNTVGASCANDAQWPGSTCASGASCERQNEWYWQCLGAAQVQAAEAKPVEPVSDLKEYAQCGGLGGECGVANCADAEYTAHKCESGLSCLRQNEYYWQCLKPSSTPSPTPVVPVEIPQYGQCGGQGGNCTTAPYGKCAPEPFPGTVCSHGHFCAKQNDYYFQCL